MHDRAATEHTLRGNTGLADIHRVGDDTAADPHSEPTRGFFPIGRRGDEHSRRVELSDKSLENIHHRNDGVVGHVLALDDVDGARAVLPENRSSLGSLIAEPHHLGLPQTSGQGQQLQRRLLHCAVGRIALRKDENCCHVNIPSR